MKIQFKSKSERKNKYLLIDGEGIIWIPKQNCDLGWNNNDSNGERVILGNINNKHEYNQIINNLICLKGR